jgi:putative peptidoglycan lipid II flippase
VALAALGSMLLAITGPNAFWLEASLGVRIGRLAVVVAAGAFAYFATLYVLGFRLRDFNRREYT